MTDFFTKRQRSVQAGGRGERRDGKGGGGRAAGSRDLFSQRRAGADDRGRNRRADARRRSGDAPVRRPDRRPARSDRPRLWFRHDPPGRAAARSARRKTVQAGRRHTRKSVVEGKRGSVWFDGGGGEERKKKKKE